MSYLSDLLGTAYKEGMTEDEISTALETMNNANATEIKRLKGLLSTANGEAAEYKRQLREKQTTEEAAAQAQQEEHNKLVQENETLKRSISLSERKAKLMGMGYDEQLADATATAMVDGDMDAVMVNQSKYLEAQKKTVLADLMRKTPRPATGGEDTGTSGMDYAKKIEEAQAAGDYSVAAYYTRLQGTEESEQE